MGKTRHSKYQHVPVSSTQQSRVKCSSLSTTAAIILLENYVCICRSSVARNTLITFVKCSLSLHLELKQDGKLVWWYEREVHFLFLSHFQSAAVNRKRFSWRYNPLHAALLLGLLQLAVISKREEKGEDWLLCCQMHMWCFSHKAKGYLAAQVISQPLGHFILYSHAISFVDLLVTCWKWVDFNFGWPLTAVLWRLLKGACQLNIQLQSLLQSILKMSSLYIRPGFCTNDCF